MKKIILLILVSTFTLSSIGQLANQTNTNSELGIDAIRAGKYSSLPSYLKFQAGHELTLESLNEWMHQKLKISDNMGLVLLRTENDKIGHVHYRFQQTYNGVPLEDAIWIAHSKDGKIYSLNGLIYPDLSAATSSSISEEQALDKALSFVGAAQYKWQIEGEEQHLKWESNDPTATYFPTAEKVYVASTKGFNARNFRLVYKFNIYAHQPLYRAAIYVDANSGQIIRENKLIHHADEPGTAHTVYSGDREIIADSFGGQYRLRDGSRGDGIRTFDLNNATTYGGAVDFTDDDNDWNNVNPQLDEYATDAHFGAEMTYDYYLDVHGRNSLDNAGFQLNSYVHYDSYFYNAFWDGSRMTYGDGDGVATPLTAIDIAGHEVTHGLTSYTANLIYSSESGALNESFSDIFGVAIDHFARPTDWNWLMGDEIGAAFRSMSNPNAFNCPDTYEGDFWDVFEEVHTNSGVQNFWYYLLTEGGSGVNDNGDAYNVTGLGFDAADAIAFRNLTVYLTPSSDYEDARYYSIAAATDLFGGCSFEVEQTANAWYAVGVGELYTAETVAAFTPSSTTGCEVPFTVSFTNESLNGVTYSWDFGDGGASTDAFPSHTYTAEGTYDVKLSVDGGVCGSDEIISVGIIVIDSDLDCPVIFPVSGTGTMLTACHGTLYDSGGSDGDYPSNSTAQITISPTDAITVQLNFIEFDVEGIPGCVYDNLRIYDGPTVASPLIGTYCNDNVPTIINSTGPSITLAFISDWIYQFEGFKMEWTCTVNIDDSGIDEINQIALDIYPNPTSNWLTIVTPTLNQGTIKIVDIVGQDVLTTTLMANSTQVDLSKYSTSGIYFVTVYDAQSNLVAVQKIILN